MKFKYLLVSLFLVFGTLSATAQEKKNFDLEDLYMRPTFYAKSPWHEFDEGWQDLRQL